MTAFDDALRAAAHRGTCRAVKNTRGDPNRPPLVVRLSGTALTKRGKDRRIVGGMQELWIVDNTAVRDFWAGGAQWMGSSWGRLFLGAALLGGGSSWGRLFLGAALLGLCA